MDLSHEERIAALLDGRYTDAERERLLAEMVANDDDMEMFAAVAAALREYEEEERAAGAVPLHAPVPEAVPGLATRPRWKPPRWVKFAVAAGLVAMVGGGLLWRGRGGGAGGPDNVLALLGQPALGAPPGVKLKPWGASRGDGEAPKAHDVRLGARLVDVQQLAGHDDTAARAAARDVARLLDGIQGANPVAEHYHALARDGVPPGGVEQEFTSRAIRLGGKAAETGVWMEMARFEAARQDSAFFQSPLSLDILNGEGPASVFEAADRAELRRIGEIAGSKRWAEVRTALDALLRRLAS